MCLWGRGDAALTSDNGGAVSSDAWSAHSTMPGVPCVNIEMELLQPKHGSKPRPGAWRMETHNGSKWWLHLVLYLIEICICPSVVKPVVINCNEDNLLRDLMLHKLSMINFIKFLSLAPCNVWSDDIPGWHYVTLHITIQEMGKMGFLKDCINENGQKNCLSVSVYSW